MYFDIHSHILPGIDDGANSPEETRMMLEMAYRDGIRGIMSTPHYYYAMDEGIWQRREAAYELACSLADQIDPNFYIYQGAEIFYESGVLTELKSGAPLTLNGTRYVLVEFPLNIDFAYIRYAVQNLQYEGFRPVIAHMERYTVLRQKHHVAALTELGAYMQVNVDSIQGKNGWRTCRYLLKLIKKGEIHLVGTDAHGSICRKPLMSPCAEYLDKKVGTIKRMQLCRMNFLKIIEGAYLSDETDDQYGRKHDEQ